jgi:hypothetical protein
MVDKRGTHKIDCNHLPGDSTIKDSTGEDPVDKKMTIRKGMTRYQLMSFLHELLFFFINSFLSFPLHIKRIILCFVYSDDHQPSFIYPSLEEEDLPSACVVDVDLVSSPQPIHKDELCIEIPLEFDHPCNLEEVELIQILLLSHHLMLLLLNLSISLLNLISIPLVFKLESETRCLNL